MRSTCVLVMLASAISCAWAVAAAASPASLTSPPSGTFNGCPTAPNRLTLSAGAYAPAVDHAVKRFLAGPYLQMARRHPGWSTKVKNAEVETVTLVPNWLPSGWIKSECGTLVWTRSVAAGVYFPALDLPHNPVGHCNDCDHVTYVLSKTAHGWVVWGNY